ncbi:MAG: hypothetical protein V4674_00995 [Patescibacteria group bacterium]
MAIPAISSTFPDIGMISADTLRGIYISAVAFLGLWYVWDIWTGRGASEDPEQLLKEILDD